MMDPKFFELRVVFVGFGLRSVIRTLHFILSDPLNKIKIKITSWKGN